MKIKLTLDLTHAESFLVTEEDQYVNIEIESDSEHKDILPFTVVAEDPDTLDVDGYPSYVGQLDLVVNKNTIEAADKNFLAVTPLEKPWYHKTIYAGKHVHFTRRHCIEQLCAHCFDNYDTWLDQDRFYTRDHGRTMSFNLAPDEARFLRSRLKFYRSVREKCKNSGKDFNLAYREIPEYRTSHDALCKDQPDLFHPFN